MLTAPNALRAKCVATLSSCRTNLYASGHLPLFGRWGDLPAYGGAAVFIMHLITTQFDLILSTDIVNIAIATSCST